MKTSNRTTSSSDFESVCKKKVFGYFDCFLVLLVTTTTITCNVAINSVRFVHVRCSYYIWSSLFCSTSGFKKNFHLTCSRSENNSFIIIRYSFSLVQFRFSLASVSLSAGKRKHRKKFFG